MKHEERIDRFNELIFADKIWATFVWTDRSSTPASLRFIPISEEESGSIARERECWAHGGLWECDNRQLCIDNVEFLEIYGENSDTAERK